VLDTDDLGSELRSIVREAGSHYSLAYQPAAGGSPTAGRSHEIEVRLSDLSLTARYRRGYVEKDAETWMTERILGALNLGISENPLGARLGAGEVRLGEKGTYRFPLHVIVPVERLAFEGDAVSRIAEVQVIVMARRTDTGALSRKEQSYRLQAAPGATGLANLPIELELEAGVYLTAVGIRDQASREASFISTTVQVGDAE
jgi:hypothetical protein